MDKTNLYKGRWHCPHCGVEAQGFFDDFHGGPVIEEKMFCQFCHKGYFPKDIERIVSVAAMCETKPKED